MADRRYLIAVLLLAGLVANVLAESNPSNVITGEVGVRYQNQIPKDPDPKLDAMLDNYREKTIKPFPWKMKYRSNLNGLSVYNVTFPSAVKTATPENNTVWCEYFQAAPTKEKQPAVIVMHILDGSFALSRIVCYELASKGINAMLVKLPYYGERKPAYSKHFMDRLDKPADLTDFIRQGVMDIRRAKAWLKSRPEIDPERVGILGMSLGGFATGIASGVDKEFKRIAIIVGGSKLSYVLCHAGAHTGHFRKQCKKLGVTEEKLADIMVPFEPLTYTSRLIDTQVFMINGDNDTIVPPNCAKALAKAANAYQIWYKGGHFKLVPEIYNVCETVIKHFHDSDWSKPSIYFDEEGNPKPDKPNLLPASAKS